MNDGNYIKINRKILEWEWYQDINTKVIFFHMLLKANWKEGKFQGTTVPRGSFISSINKLSTETNLTEREIRTAISHLKSTGEVTSKATNKFTVFTVLNYNCYQANDKQTDIQPPNERQTNDIQTTTIEERKEGKKEKNNNKDVANPVSESATFPPESFEMLCVEKLIQSVVSQFQGAKVPDTIAAKIKWCDHIEKMIRLDHRSEQDIQEALNFAITDQFWKTNIRSTKTLRDKFETLIMQSRKKKGTGAAKSKPNQFQNFPQREIDYDALVLQQLQGG